MVESKDVGRWGTGFALGALMLLAGCGDTVGTGQCGGVEDDGLCITIDHISPSYLGAGNISVDVDRDFDCSKDGATTTTDIEPYATHQADVMLSISFLSSKGSDSVPQFITLTQYQIDYVLNPGPFAGPALSSRTYSDTFKMDAGTTGNTFRVIMVDLDSKDEYAGTGVSLGIHPSYTANYTFFGTDSLQNSVVVRGSTEFEIGGFEYCGA